MIDIIDPEPYIQGLHFCSFSRGTVVRRNQVLETTKKMLVPCSDQEATATVNIIKNPPCTSVYTPPADCSTPCILSRASPAGLTRPGLCCTASSAHAQ